MSQNSSYQEIGEGKIIEEVNKLYTHLYCLFTYVFDSISKISSKNNKVSQSYTKSLLFQVQIFENNFYKMFKDIILVRIYDYCCIKVKRV